MQANETGDDPADPLDHLLNLVWAEDEEFGLYLWTAFITGGRRGGVTALRENSFDFTSHQVRVARNYLVKPGQRIEKAPKDGESLRLSLDLLTCELFRDRFRRRRPTGTAGTPARFFAQFTRPADQQAAAIIPASLDGLRKKERLRELYRQPPPPNWRT